AVSIGMIFAAELAYELKMISEDLLKRHYSILNLIGLPTSYQAANLVELLPIMAIDKKATSKILRFVLLSELAVPVFVSNPEATTLATAFDRLVSEG
ncbi:MAG: 3-dehydroquinate synthase, partial [Actinomycetota bacterium]|nr:3-dehydroquinate synthase [Actinomycetota bacterium]